MKDFYKSVKNLTMDFTKGENADHVKVHNAIVNLLLQLPVDSLIYEIFALRNQMGDLIIQHNLNLNEL